MTASSGAWQYNTISFGVTFKQAPVVVVYPFSTGSAPDPNFMIDNVSVTGFRIGRYTARAQQYIWMAIGIKA